jgi:hypothetical protein
MMTVFPASVHKQLGHLLGCIPFATQRCVVPASKRLPATMLVRGAGRKQGGRDGCGHSAWHYTDMKAGQWKNLAYAWALHVVMLFMFVEVHLDIRGAADK